MSVLIEKIASNIGSSKPNTKYPPGNVTNVTIDNNSTTDTLTIKWKSPNNVTVGGLVVSEFGWVEIILKEGSSPSSNRDGVKIYDGKSDNVNPNTSKTSVCNTGSIVLSDTKTYYIRFFVYSKDNVCNDDPSMSYSFKPTLFVVDRILANNSWETINKVAEAGKGQDYWNIGDEITIELEDYFPIVLQIYDFNHFDKSDGSGKAGILFGTKRVEIEGQFSSYDGTWDYSFLRETTMVEEIYKNIPKNIRQYIKQVNTIAGDGSNNGGTITSKDYVFIPGLSEVFNSYSVEDSASDKTSRFPIFTEYNNVAKQYRDKPGNVAWWTRTPNKYNNWDYFYIITERAGVDTEDGEYINGVVFCFNV